MITEAAEHKYINFNSSDWAWALTHLPLIIMIILLAYLPSAAKLLLEYSGYVAVLFLVITLVLNPIKSMEPNWIWVSKLNRYRKHLGVACFSYTSFHFVCFFADKGFDTALRFFVHPALFPCIFIAFPILLALTIGEF